MIPSLWLLSARLPLINRNESDSSGYMHKKNLSFVGISKCTLNKNKDREKSNKIISTQSHLQAPPSKPAPDLFERKKVWQ
jgi:hypothetical protein